MNRLIIIGNGFDLAHGLPTRYEDFIKDYFLQAFEKAYERRDNPYEDELIKVSRGNMTYGRDGFETFKKIFKSDSHALNQVASNSSHIGINGSEKSSLNIFTFTTGNYFIKELLHGSKENWANIEQFYFDTLINVAKKEIDPNLRSNQYRGSLEDLNSGFKFLKERFEDYLKGVVGKSQQNFNKEILRLWLENYRKSDAFKDETNAPLRASEKLILLNFNYTNTVSEYLKEIKRNHDLQHEPVEIQIHGKVGDRENPIIFGFGDEMDDNYKILERRNNSRYLDYMKSFGYFKTNNYRELQESINAAPFEVYMMGHSCGLSDRVMLNMIFEHANCKSIKVFYYQDKAGNSNYLGLTQNISRHFNDKGLMRQKVRSEMECEPLPSLSVM